MSSPFVLITIGLNMDRRLAAALRKLGVARGDTVSVMASNTPEVIQLLTSGGHLYSNGLASTDALLLGKICTIHLRIWVLLFWLCTPVAHPGIPCETLLECMKDEPCVSARLEIRVERQNPIPRGKPPAQSFTAHAHIPAAAWSRVSRQHAWPPHAPAIDSRARGRARRCWSATGASP